MQTLSATVLVHLLCQLISLTSSSNVIIVALIGNQTALHTVKPLPSANLPRGYIAHPDIGVAWKFHKRWVPWKGARSQCIAEGADLVVIDSKTKFDRVYNQTSSIRSMHVGILRMYDEWINVRTGKNLYTVPWGRKEPSNVWDCVFTDFQNGLVNNRCHHERAFICEIPINGESRPILSSNIANAESARNQQSLLTPNSLAANLPQGYIAHHDLGVALKYHDEELAWQEARQGCIAEGADLVSVDSVAKSERVSSQRLPSDSHMHVGISRTGYNKQWTNIRTGSSPLTLLWGPGEPSGNWNCVTMIVGSIRLGNWPCSDKRTYMCEIPINGSQSHEV